VRFTLIERLAALIVIMSGAAVLCTVSIFTTIRLHAPRSRAASKARRFAISLASRLQHDAATAAGYSLGDHSFPLLIKHNLLGSEHSPQLECWFHLTFAWSSAMQLSAPQPRKHRVLMPFRYWNTWDVIFFETDRMIAACDVQASMNSLPPTLPYSTTPHSPSCYTASYTHVKE